MEEQMRCFYLDGAKQNASDMLRNCVQDQTSPYGFNCVDNPMRQETFSDITMVSKVGSNELQVIEDLEDVRSNTLKRARYLKTFVMIESDPFAFAKSG